MGRPFELVAEVLVTIHDMKTNASRQNPRPTEYPAQLVVMTTQPQYDYVDDEAKRRGVSKAVVMREAIELHRRRLGRQRD